MTSTCLFVMLLVSNRCDHRIVVGDRDCGEFCLVTPMRPQPYEGAQVTSDQRQEAQRGDSIPAQSPSAASAQHPVTQRNRPALLPAAVFPEAVRSSACSDGKCSSSVFRRWRRR